MNYLSNQNNQSHLLQWLGYLSNLKNNIHKFSSVLISSLCILHFLSLVGWHDPLRGESGQDSCARQNWGAEQLSLSRSLSMALSQLVCQPSFLSPSWKLDFLDGERMDGFHRGSWCGVHIHTLKACLSKGSSTKMNLFVNQNYFIYFKLWSIWSGIHCIVKSSVRHLWTYKSIKVM